MKEKEHVPLLLCRFRSDTLLGLASVPLTPLLQDCWVDGYAPVYALMATQGPQDNTVVREERVQVGMLRVVIALEDKGQMESAIQPVVVAPTTTTMAEYRSVDQGHGHAEPVTRQQSAGHTGHQVHQSASQPVAAAATNAVVPQTSGTLAPQPQVSAAPAELPEYEAAYQVELWKKGGLWSCFEVTISTW